VGLAVDVGFIGIRRGVVGGDDGGQREELVIGWERQGNNPYFILAKVEAGAGDVPAAARDSQENKYLFMRYIEKSENLKIPTSTLSRTSEPRAK